MEWTGENEGKTKEEKAEWRMKGTKGIGPTYSEDFNLALEGANTMQNEEKWGQERSQWSKEENTVVFLIQSYLRLTLRQRRPNKGEIDVVEENEKGKKNTM